MNYEVIDNYLPEANYLALVGEIMSHNFPWFFDPKITHEITDSPYDYQFVHTFFKDNKAWSPSYALLDPLFANIQPKAIIRAKANLNPATGEHYYGGWHSDLNFPCTTAVYYLNTNNGWTEFESGEKVESVGNRLLIFDSNMIHSGVTSTSSKARAVLNLNYFA